MAGNLNVDQISNSAGTGPVSFPNGITFPSSTFVAPTVQKFTSSTGTYTLPTSPRSPLYIRVVMSGGGGGGGGGGQTNVSGSSGGISTFGTSLLTCNGGLGGFVGGTFGGTASLGSGPTGIALTGGSGIMTGGNAAISTVVWAGGTGGNNPLGGASSSLAGASGAGNPAAANTGAGGAGGTSNNVLNSFAGAGGNAGGYIEAYISSPSATYTYAVGVGGAGGTAGTSGQSGGSGGSGLIFITEYYQ